MSCRLGSALRMVCIGGLCAVALGCGPQGPMGILPGGPLAGSAVPGPVADWSFTDDQALVSIETRGDWIDHSVTVLCTSHGPHLYIPSRHAPNKRWVQNILADPRVRIGVEGKIYEGRAFRVSDPVEGEAVARATLRKYLGIDPESVRSLRGPPEEGDDRAEVWTFRIESTGSES